MVSTQAKSGHRQYSLVSNMVLLLVTFVTLGIQKMCKDEEKKMLVGQETFMKIWHLERQDYLPTNITASKKDNKWLFCCLVGTMDQDKTKNKIVSKVQDCNIINF